MNDQAGRSIPIVAHVFTLDCESFKLQLGDGRGNWYEVQITGRPRALPGRTCLTVSTDKRLTGKSRGSDSTFPVLIAAECPFANSPDTRKSRFGEELNAEKMKKAVWLRPEVVVEIEFLEWTEADRLRHSTFVRLREDKPAREVIKEHDGGNKICKD